MNEKQSRVVIIEGGQACGKTTVTNLLRELVPYCNLYRLSGIKDKSEDGHRRIRRHYDALADFLDGEATTQFTQLFDRTFTTEVVYARIAHTQYSFDKDYNELWARMENLAKVVPVYYFVLTMPPEKLEQTIQAKATKREHAGIHFEVNESLVQQAEFLRLLEDCHNVYGKEIKCDNLTAEQAAVEIIDYITAIEESWREIDETNKP